MIKTENGTVNVKGTAPDLMADLGIIIHSLHKNISKDIGAEGSKEMIMNAVNMGLSSEEEIKRMVREAKETLLKMMFERLV